MKKLIIDIDEKDYEVIKRECSNKDVVPVGWVQILNGKTLQAEFEKLKAGIQAIPQVHIKTGEMNLDKELVVPLNKVIEKLDKHISELKGENNDL